MTPEPALAPAVWFFMLFRAAYVGAGLLALLWLWRRPRPAAALVLLLGLNVCAWAAYVAPLQRLYALGERGDRGFNVGMAACAAADGSPWDHVQVKHAAVEPFWNLLVAALAGFRPERVLRVYHWLAPAAIVLVGLGLYRGLRGSGDEQDGWERVWLVFAVLGLASCSLSQRPPTPPFWAGNFLLKPNHAIGFALLAAVLGLAARRARASTLGLGLGLLAWVFLAHWGFLVLTLALLAALRRGPRRELAGLAAAVGLSLLVAAPDLANLLRDYAPWAAGSSARGVWSEMHLGRALALPQWALFDPAPLVLLGAAGGFLLRRRAAARDQALLALLLCAWLLWLGYVAAARLGWAPNPDDAHYFLRFATALAGGAALAHGARLLETRQGWLPGRGSVLGLGLLLPLSFPALWDPPSMDRYWRFDRQPISHDFQEYGAWIRAHTPRDAVFVAGPSSATWVPVLAGRRVLLASDARPPADYDERKRVERLLLTSDDAPAVRSAARAWGITYVAIDPRLRLEYGPALRADQPRHPVFETVFDRPALTILRVREQER